MSVEIIAREDRGASVDSSGAVSFSHVIQFEGDSLMEIVSSTLLPQRGSRHPQNTAFFLDSLEVQPNGNKGRRVQALATLNYSNSTELTRYYGGDPWDLGAQNVTETTQEAQIAFISGWDERGNEIANVNSAGCRILSETTEPIIVLSFSYNLEAFDRREPKIGESRKSRGKRLSIQAPSGSPVGRSRQKPVNCCRWRQVMSRNTARKTNSRASTGT